MNRITCCTAVLLFFTSLTGNSQDEGISITPKIGANMSRLNIDEDAENVVGPSSFKINPDFGVDVNIHIASGLSFRPGVHYKRRTGAFNEVPSSFINMVSDFESEFGDGLFPGGSMFSGALLGLNNIDIQAEYSLTYLHFPLQLAYRLETGEHTAVHFLGGPYAALALAGYYEVTVDPGGLGFGSFGSDFQQREDFDFENDFRQFDFGLSLGSGFEFHNFLISLHYGFGLMEATHEDARLPGQVPVPFDFSVKNQFIECGVGYRIGL